MTISSSGRGTLLRGASGLPVKKLETVLNEEAANGWEVVFQVIESRRFWLFWTTLRRLPSTSPSRPKC